MLAKEITFLREELKKIMDDRDRLQGQLNAVMLEREKYIKFKYETYSKLDKLASKTEALEVGCFILSSYLIITFLIICALSCSLDLYNNLLPLQNTCSSQKEKITLLEKKLCDEREKLEVIQLCFIFNME